MQETLPVIAEGLGIQDEIQELTRATIQGKIPFVESFIQRVRILSRQDPRSVSALLADVPINEDLANFMNANPHDCIIATGNLRNWIEPLVRRFDCEVQASEGQIASDGSIQLTNILRKEDLVRSFQRNGESVVFVGDGHNDAEAMRIADVSIACGVVHQPANSVLEVCDYVVYDSKAIVRLLNQIAMPSVDGLSVIITAAGTGSRLGLGTTKSLIEIAGTSLIKRQLDLFSNVEDLRIVVGFQASEVISEVLKIRRDAIFAFNHDYFQSRTALSMYRGARHGNSLIKLWDGDLIVHPEDALEFLSQQRECIGISSLTTSDGVFVQLDSESRVVGFTQERTQYEWSGPLAIARDKVTASEGHVFEVLEPHLPIASMQMRAIDIDTHNDYQQAINYVSSWERGNTAIHNYYDQLAQTITDPIQTRNRSLDFTKYDVELLKRYSGTEKRLLDLGAGTGLSLNSVVDLFRHVTAIEKYEEFSQFIVERPNVEVINDDLRDFTTNDRFDVISAFGVMNFFNANEALDIYRLVRGILRQSGVFLIKHQMGVADDVVVDGFSDELHTHYYSEYRTVERETSLLNQAGLTVSDVVDPYPDEFNRWSNTRFRALICEISSV